MTAKRSDTKPDVLVLEESGSTILIAAGSGANLFSWQVTVKGKRHELLYTAPGFPSPEHKPSHHGTPILAPFPNRIRGGRFRYRGKDYAILRNERDVNAIHGLVIDQPWRVERLEEKDGASVAHLVFQLSVDRPDRLADWPSDFLLDLIYRLRGGGELDIEFRVTNPGPEVLPFGFGTHPYFKFPLLAESTLAAVEIVVPARKRVELADYLPTGQLGAPTIDLEKGVRLGEVRFDDVFTDLVSDKDGVIRHYLRDHDAGVELLLEHGPEFPFTVVYTPPHGRAACIEPYTCVTDAINLERAASFPTGLWEIAPGAHRAAVIRHRVGALEG